MDVARSCPGPEGCVVHADQRPGCVRLAASSPSSACRKVFHARIHHAPQASCPRLYQRAARWYALLRRLGRGATDFRNLESAPQGGQTAGAGFAYGLSGAVCARAQRDVLRKHAVGRRESRRVVSGRGRRRCRRPRKPCAGPAGPSGAVIPRSAVAFHQQLEASQHALPASPRLLHLVRIVVAVLHQRHPRRTVLFAQTDRDRVDMVR
jgi:hypothetical protein